jgi:enoyl-CoA hydratase
MTETATMPALLVERDGPVAVLTMNRPQAKNAINPEMLCRLADAWDLIDSDDAIHAAILTGAGGSFCAGADLDKLVAASISGAPPENDFERRCREDGSVIFKGLLRNHRLAKPLIAAVEGSCIAGGTEILQSTDIRVAAEGATFAIAEVRWGLFPIGGSTVRLRRQIPYTAAAEMLLTGDQYSAQEAFRMGLIGRVVPDGQALSAARAIASRIAKNGPVAVRQIKKSLQETEALAEEKALEVELGIGLRVFQTEDAKEGPRAFKEKREPQFKGR